MGVRWEGIDSKRVSLTKKYNACLTWRGMGEGRVSCITILMTVRFEVLHQSTDAVTSIAIA